MNNIDVDHNLHNFLFQIHYNFYIKLNYLNLYYYYYFHYYYFQLNYYYYLNLLLFSKVSNNKYPSSHLIHPTLEKV